LSTRVPTWRIAADLVTGGVFTCGVLAITSREDPARLVTLVVVAALLDGVDGALARRAGGPSAHGAALDVLADMTAFGVAPVVLVLMKPQLGSSSAVVLALLAVYLLASLYRLIRSGRAYQRYSRAYCGLPMPVAGTLLMGMGLALPIPLLVTGTALVSLLVVTRQPYPIMAWMWHNERFFLVALMVLGLILFPISQALALLLASGSYAVYPWLSRLRHLWEEPQAY
jgi:phosphatidylserine synthase